MSWMKKTLIILILFFGCTNHYNKKVICEKGKKQCITIFQKESHYYIYQGNISIGNEPSNGYVINEGVVEYFNALVRWIDGVPHIYYTYGIYDDSNSDGRVIVKKITVKQFEQLKKNPEYSYFYY